MLTAKDKDVILAEMFSRVGIEYEPTYVEKSGWYLTASWSAAEQESFRQWLIKYLLKRFKPMESYAIKQADWFILNYGWTTMEAE